MIAGKFVGLRAIESEDAENIVSWRNLEDVSSEMFSLRGPTMDEHQKWFRCYKENLNRHEFMIIVLDTGEAIGTVGLSDINPFHRKAEYGILIGAQSQRGKGYAREATELILNYAFNTLRLQKVSLRVFSDNYKAIRLYESAGFQKEGLLRSEFLKDGSFRDVVLMAAFSGSEAHAD